MQDRILKVPYPDQCFKLRHESKQNKVYTTLSVDGKLQMPSEIEYVQGSCGLLERYGKYSKFGITLIESRYDQDGEDKDVKKYAHFNLEPHDIPSLYEDAKALKHASFMERINGKEEMPANYPKEDALAYEQKLFMKPFSKMTPAEVLTESGDNRVKLREILEQLVKNVQDPKFAKFAENNKNQARAIKRAIELFDTGKLIKSTKPAAVEIFSRYKSLYDYPDENGNFKENSFKITYDKSMNQSIEVVIMNRLINQKTKEVAEEKFVSFRMTVEEFFAMTESMQVTKTQYDQAIATFLFQKHSTYKKQTAEQYGRRSS